MRRPLGPASHSIPYAVITGMLARDNEQVKHLTHAREKNDLEQPILEESICPIATTGEGESQQFSEDVVCRAFQ